MMNEKKRNILLWSIPLLFTLLTAGFLARPGPGAVQGPAEAAFAPVGDGFTYQGLLTEQGGSPVISTCDFSFSLWDALSGGVQIGSSSVVSGVAVTDGYFATLVNSGGEFGADAFAGEARWLAISVRCISDPSYTALSPRQPLHPAPYAHYSQGAPWSGLTGVPDLQARVSDSCTTGSAIRVINANGTVTCEPVGGVDPHHHWGESWSGRGTGLMLANSEVGLYGSGSDYGLHGSSAATTGYGVFGETTAATGINYGVRGEAASTSGAGVSGLASAATGITHGVQGLSSSTAGRGVYGAAVAGSGEAYGVFGLTFSTAGTGVKGRAATTSGTTYGVYGEAESIDGIGVYGLHIHLDGTAPGLMGESNSTASYATAVVGQTTSTSPGPYSSGVRGISLGTGSTGIGVWGSHESSGWGVFGYAPSGRGVYGGTQSDTGVYGNAGASTGTNYGVYGRTQSPDGYAGYFSGDVHVTGDLSASGTKPFKINHPLDPANQYLFHYSVESPEVLNQYTGNVTLNEDGTAWVTLPAWFEAINRDYRYQLTCIGDFAPVYTAQEIQDNRFQIAGGEPGLKVSWEVTALRSDPYLEYYDPPVEMDKPAEARGTYLHPEFFGQPPALGLDNQHLQAAGSD
jgi:hypothetical protein